MRFIRLRRPSVAILLALGMARLETWSPGYRRIGLSATVPDADALLGWLGGQEIVRGAPGAAPEVEVLASENEIPWAGHTGRHLMGEGVRSHQARGRDARICKHARAGGIPRFRNCGASNEDHLPIALHHRLAGCQSAPQS